MPKGKNDILQGTLQIEALPGIQSASVAQYAPLTFSSSSTSILVSGFSPQTRSDGEAYLNSVAPHFFAAMGIPLSAGRDLTWADREDSSGSVVINQALAKHFFNGRNPIGEEIRTPKGANLFNQWTVVGIVGDAKFNVLGRPAPPTIYFSYRQPLFGLGAMEFIVRTAGEPHAAISMLQNTMSGVDRNVPLTLIKTEKEFVDLQILPERTLGILLVSLAVATLLMVCLGIYGTLTYTAIRRTSEFGVRMALGANGRDIVVMTIRESLAPVAVGIVLGVGISLIVARVMQGVLFGVASTDPMTIIISVVLLLFTATLAAAIPARRALRIDPMTALRYE